MTTHQVEEIQRYLEVTVHPGQVVAARALRPICERQVFSRGVLLFDRVDRSQLAAFDDVRTPSIADIFVALRGDTTRATQGVV